MRRFVVFLGLFGVVLGLLTASGYVFLAGQIPPVQLSGEGWTIRADSAAWAQTARPELEGAVRRFRALLGEVPPIEVALLGAQKKLNAVSVYVALRKATGTPLDRLPVPFPTRRLAAILEAAEPESGRRLGRNALGHEIGHWLLEVYAGAAGGGRRGADAQRIPPWLEEGIAGYCESKENRLRRLLLLRGVGPDSIRLMPPDTLLAAPMPHAGRRLAPADRYDAVSSDGELFIAQSTLLVAFLEARHPGLVRKLVHGALEGRTADTPLLRLPGPFEEWLRTLAAEEV